MASSTNQSNDLLRRQRKLRCWTLNDVANALYDLCTSEGEVRERGDINAQMISGWECGKHLPSPFWQKMLGKLYNKSAEELGFIVTQAPTGQPTIFVPDKPSLILANRLPEQHSAQHFSENSTEQRSSDLRQAKDGKISRRQVLPLLASVPFLSIAHISHLLNTEELLSLYATNIPICWRLYFDGYLLEAESVLSTCLSPLSALACQASQYQQWSASLASKAHQLACMLSLQSRKFGEALMHAKQAFQYGHVAGDPNVQVASLIRKGLVYFYLKRPEQKLEAYQEAMLYYNAVSPLLRGRVYMGLAEAHSNFGQKQEYEAQHYLDLAHRTFPEHPKEDPNFAYTYFKLPQEYGGLIYLNLNQPGKAWDAFARVDEAVTATIAPERVELSIRQARACAALGYMQQTCDYLETAVTSAIALGSDLRYDEAFEVYQQVQLKWGHERRVKELGDLFIG